MKLLWMAALGACGCGMTSTQAVGNERPRAATASLGAVLGREVGGGKPVAIIAGTGGVRAISIDGARGRVLAPEAARWVVVDARSNVVWFGSADGTAIRAIDLDVPAPDRPAIETVVTELPRPGHAEMVGPVSYGIAYPAPDLPLGAAAMAPDFATGSCCATASVTLFVMLEPAVAGGAGYARDGEWQDQMERAKLPGRAFVAALARRADHRGPRPASPPATKVPGVDPSGCEDPGDCGKAEPIAGTRYLRVIVATATGDVHHIVKRLYDGEARQFVDAAWSTWLQNAWVAPDGSAFIANGVVVRFDTGPLAATAAKEAGLGGGWLPGGVFYGF